MWFSPWLRNRTSNTSLRAQSQSARTSRPRRRPAFRRPQLETLEDRWCPSSSTVVLPISAFLAQQGHDMVLTPPVRDQLSWSNSTFDPGTGIPTRDLLVDYTGQEAQFLLAHGINLHTSVMVVDGPVPSDLVLDDDSV